MTYFESLGQGVPVLAFENETSTFLEEEAVGWTVPRGNVSAMAEKINYLALNREEVRKNLKLPYGLWACISKKQQSLAGWST